MSSQVPGPGRGNRRERGRNISATWDWLGGVTPMLEAMFNKWDSMARIAERSARVRPSMEQHAFQQKQKEWEQQNKLFQEQQNQMKIERDRQARADMAARQDRARAIGEARRQETLLAAQGVAGNAGMYGGTSPHQSEAQLAGWGVEGAVYDKNGNLVPMSGMMPSPVAPGVGAPGAGAGYINVSANSGMVPLTQGPTYAGNPMVPPASAFGAMTGQSIPEFESADIDKERKKKDD